MKKKLFGIIAALSCFACLGGCLDDKAADKDSTGGTSEGGSVAGVNLEAAKAILKSMYFEDEYTNNNVDYEYVTILQNVAGVDYEIEWSVNVTEGVVLENKGGTVLVNVNEGAMNAIDYVLTAKIVAPDGSSIEQQFIRTVKAMDKYVTNGVTATPVAGKDYYLYVYQTTLAQHMYFTGNMDGYYFETTANAEEAVAINVEFVNGSTTNFYPYFVKDVEDTEGNVTKDVKHYIGMRLSEDGAHNNVVFDTAPITEFYYSTKYQTVVTKMATDKDGNTNAEFYLGNYAANDTISGSLASQYFGGAGNNVGNLVEIVDRTTVPNADKVKTTLDTLSVSAKYYEAATERLAERGVMFLETTVAWTSSNTDLIAIDGYNMTVNMPTEATEVTITATATCGDATDTKEFKVNLIPLPYAREATLTIPQALELAQVVGGDYTPGKYYVEGTVKSIANTTYGNLYIEDAEGNELYVYGTYDATGANRYDKMENAPQVGDTVKVYGVLGTYKDTAQFKNAWVVEHKAAEGGEVTPPEGGEDETPDLTTTEGILKALYALADGESLTGPFTITGKITEIDSWSNPTIVVEGFETMPVYCYRLKVTNAVGDTITVTAQSMKNHQGTYEFMDCTLVSSEVGGGDEGGDEGVTNPELDEAKAYKLFLTQVTNNKVLYLDGGVNGRYLTMTEDASASIDVYAEKANAGYKFYTLVDNVKQYVNIYFNAENKVSVNYTADSTCVYSYNAESNCWYTNVNGTDYYLGTYSTFNTVSASKTSYINAENTGVEQFPLELVAKDEIGGGDEGGEVTPPEGGEGETHEHSGYAEDYKCDECSAVVEPEADTTLTLAQAIKLADALGAGNYSTNKYYLTCEIVSVYNTQYGNANVTDADGTDYVIYGLYMGDTRYDALTYKPVTGDELTVYGQVGSYSKDGSTLSSYQMKDAQIDDIVAHEHDYQAVVTEPTCTAEGYTTHTCSICADTYKDSETPALGHTTDNGTCENCGKEISAENPGLTAKSYSYTMAKGDFTGNGTKALNGVNWTFEGTSTYVGWDNNNGKGFQFGSGSAPNESMSFTSESFSNVSKIVINTSGAKSIAGSCKVYVGETLVDTITLTATATDYTIELSEALSGEVRFEYTQTSSKAIYIKSIAVDYAE